MIAGGLVLLTVTADRLFAHQVTRREWIGVALAALGLAFLAATLEGAGRSAHSDYEAARLVAYWVAGLATWRWSSPRPAATSRRRGVVLGASAGLFWAASDTSIKALSGHLGDAAAASVLLSPLAAVIALASFAGLVVSARSLQIGKAVPVIAVTSVAANVVHDRGRADRLRRAAAGHLARAARAPARLRPGDLGGRADAGAHPRGAPRAELAAGGVGDLPHLAAVEVDVVEVAVRADLEVHRSRRAGATNVLMCSGLGVPEPAGRCIAQMQPRAVVGEEQRPVVRGRIGAAAWIEGQAADRRAARGAALAGNHLVRVPVAVERAEAVPGWE